MGIGRGVGVVGRDEEEGGGGKGGAGEKKVGVRCEKGNGGGYMRGGVGGWGGGAWIGKDEEGLAGKGGVVKEGGKEAEKESGVERVTVEDMSS